MASAKRMVLALLAVALAIGFVSVAAPPARAASDSFSLYGSFTSGWGNSSATETTPMGPTLIVAQGDSVTITLHSSDGVTHEFFIDLDGNLAPSAGEPTSSQFNTTTTVPTFTANQAGTFTYYCYFHETTMKGTFIVRGSGSPPPSGSGGIGGDTLLILGVVLVVVVVAGVGVIAMRRRPKQPKQP
jgi:FtsP/CotA-like multicopper oxidase with cupredoxin domain